MEIKHVRYGHTGDKEICVIVPFQRRPSDSVLEVGHEIGIEAQIVATKHQQGVGKSDRERDEATAVCLTTVGNQK